MRSSMWRALAASLVLSIGVTARAEDPPERFHLFARHHQNKEGTPPPGKPRCIPHTDERAGYPRALDDHLEPTSTPGGIGYYVGGGVPVGHRHAYADGACRRRDEGTWGWDETGSVSFPQPRDPGLVAWPQVPGRHGRYRTDGPVVPDLVYATTSTLNSLGRREEAEGQEEGTAHE